MISFESSGYQDSQEMDLVPTSDFIYNLPLNDYIGITPKYDFHIVGGRFDHLETEHIKR